MYYSRRNFGDPGDKPQFNQAALFIESLNELNKEINLAHMSGDLIKAYRGIETVLTMIKYKIKADLDKDIQGTTYKGQLEDTEKLLKEIAGGLLTPDKKRLEMNMPFLDGKINEAKELVYAFQWSLNLILPPKIKKPWELEVAEDFDVTP